MKRVLMIGLAVAAVAVGGTIWFFSQGNAEPTTDVTAPEIATTQSLPVAVDGSTTSEARLDIPTLFELIDESTATFTLAEELRGQPTTVVGTSSVVVGQIEIDPADLSGSQIGTILISARDFTTDSSNRNRAIRGPILDTDAVEFIEFAPTAIKGLNGPAQVGIELEFTVTGDLKIRDVVRTVSFDVVATLSAADRLEGSARTTVLRSDFDLQIPSVPGVANVTDEVQIALQFVAAPA